MTFIESAGLLGAGGIALWLYFDYHRLKLKHELKRRLDEMQRGILTRMNSHKIEIETDVWKVHDRILQSNGDRFRAVERRIKDEHELLARGVASSITGVEQLAKIMCAQSKSFSNLAQFQTNSLQTLIRALYPVFLDTYEDFMDNEDYEKATTYQEILKEIQSITSAETQIVNLHIEQEESDDREEEEQNA